jgi:protein SCO1/2
MRKRRTILAAALVVAAFVWVACREEAATQQAVTKLDVDAEAAFRGEQVAAFELVDQTGKVTTREDLLGHALVLDFVFTTCTGPCPLVSANMAKVQELVKATKVKLATFTVDPETDTPEVLTKYAAEHGADTERWRFLTGPEEQIDGVLRSFWLGREKSAGAALGMQVTHSTRLIVLDAKGFVRGMYDGQSDAGVEAAAARAKWLERNPGR